MTVIPFRTKAQLLPNPTKPEFTDTSVSLPPPHGISAIGIDLGTSNSVVSIYTSGCQHPETLKFESDFLVPSVLYFDNSTHSEVVGKKAKNLLKSDPTRVIRSTKRSMGTRGSDFSSGNKRYSPEQAATAILKYIAGHPMLEQEKKSHGGIWAVITVPAHFDDAARIATVDAARDSGIHVLRILNEPTAAALAYSMLSDVKEMNKETVAVFDFGGGTFDVSIVEREGLVFKVLASEGDVQLGGDDLDKALAQHLLTSVSPKLTARSASPESELFRKLLGHAERAKVKFQAEGVVHISDHNLDGFGAEIDVSISRDIFEQSSMTFVARTLELTERAMHAAKKRPSQVSRILLVGGSSRVNLVHKMLEEYFPGCLVDARLEPDLAVSWGASVQAAIILGIEPDTILVDVCSHTLGIGVAEDNSSVGEHFRAVSKKFGIDKKVSNEQLHMILGDKIEQFNLEMQKMLRVAPIIYRNSSLPARRSEFFSTLHENQNAVQVIVVQGEKDTVGENKFLGSFLFELEQPCPAGSRCEIQLTYDVNGMVHVLARQLETANECEAIFDSRTGQVEGWRRIEEKISPSHQNPQSVLHQNTPKERGQVRILNALLARARRFYLSLPLESDVRKQLTLLCENYAKLLRNAQLGEHNEEAMEIVEDEIINLIENSAV